MYVNIEVTHKKVIQYASCDYISIIMTTDIAFQQKHHWKFLEHVVKTSNPAAQTTQWSLNKGRHS